MTPRALVVDDSLTVRMDLCEALEAAGFEVVPCANVASAREALQGGPFSVVLLDVRLPDGDGVELLAALKAEEATHALPVMLLSTEAEVSARVRGLRTGADAYIGKPYDVANVVARARALTRASSGRPPRGEGPVILVIDDSPTVRDELDVALTRAGYGVLAAESGEEGLRIAANERPAAVIVDGDLPGIDGAAVIRRIRIDALLRTTPCILLTGSDGGADEPTALDAGADAYFRKGDDTDLVLARLAAVLRSPATPERGRGASGELGPKKVLAVDDSPTFLHETAALLRTDGYEVVTATTGEEALELLGVEAVDCILLDVMLPGLSGNQTCARIKATASLRDIPVVLLTARAERDAMIAGINAGADDFVAKSSDVEVLRARLRAQLRRKQFSDENRVLQQELLRRELDAHEARASRALADERAAHLRDLELKNHELARAKEQAERESQFKSKFLASVSHELRTPLNAIIGFSELLQQDDVGPLGPIQREFVTDILTSGQHLLGLINDILDLSKIEAGKMELERRPVAMAALGASVCRVVAPLAHKEGVDVVTDLAEEMPSISADPIRMKQILYNLLSNAIKFTPRGGSVRLVITAHRGAMTIDVIDTGVGIRAEDMPRLFTEFERLGSAAIEGTGLGLPLTKRFIELHGGTIVVESEPDKGTHVRVTLPLDGGAAGAAR